jgi:hypothetical protein
MKEFSATDAAFEGFRVARERPRAIAAWAALAFVLEIISNLLRATLAGSAASEFVTAMQQATPDRAHVMQLFNQLLPSTMAILATSVIFYGVMLAAAFRVVFEPKTAGTGLRLGMQEVRQMMVLAVVGLVMFLAIVGVLFIGGLISGLANLANPAFGALMTTLTVLAWIATTIIVPIRLSLSGPQTFAEHRLRPFQSWELTRKHFWPVTGTFLLAIAFSILVTLLGLIILAGIFAATGAQFAALVKPPTELAGYFSPMRLLLMTGSAILTALTWAILVCPAAVIYRHLHDEPA